MKAIYIIKGLLPLLLMVLPWGIDARAQSGFLRDLAKLPLVSPEQNRTVAPWPFKESPIRIVIDTDAANEVDDQFAIALAIGFPGNLKIEGFIAAHYGLRGGSDGIQKSYYSLLEVLEKAGKKDKYIVKKGSDPIVYLDKIPESEGVDFIIEKAHASTPEDPLWLIALGPATDAAAALLKDPSIADKIVIFWHGRTKWPDQCWNFNAYNDIKAVQVLFDFPTRFVLFDTGTYLTMPMEESEKRIMTAGTLGNYLHDLRKRSAYASRADKGLFDMGDIAALIDHSITRWEIVDIPSVGHDLKYDFTLKKGKFVRIYDISRDSSFLLLDEALSGIKSNN